MPGQANPSGEAGIRDAIDQAEVVEFPQGGGDGDSLNLACAYLPKNDVGNAKRLIKRYGPDLTYVEGIGWFCWEGTHWDGERGDLEAQLRAHWTAGDVKEEAEAIVDDGPFEDEADKDFQERVAKHRSWGVGSGNSNRIHSMLRESVPYLARRLEDMDADAFLFNVQNGTLHLGPAGDDTEGVWLKPHDRADRISKVAPVAFKAAADAPIFQAFLQRILPDPEIRGFVQRWFGYCLTADTSEQALVLFHGQGANGKSTLIEVVSWIMGRYGLALPFASLLHDDKRRGSEATPDIARLPGARLVSASEPEIGQRFSESLLKSLTGGETITARHLNRDFFEFQPTFKLVLSFNHKPSVRGQDEGIWRRLLMVPFDVTIPEPERDRALLSKLKDEGSGILNWLLDGFRLWVEGGLAVPDGVRAATDAYRSESDPVGQFLASATRHDPGATVQASRLYKAYELWCKDSAVTPLKQTAFGKTLGDRGYKRSKIGTYYYSDLALEPGYDPDLQQPGDQPYGDD
ncbi:phage/plasmid primase, P4 family [Pelagibius sp.]|uniref:DNA primase family protein n=1 Tax=Pelagibius sp. TaxID=1931238 RepID=UPI0026320A81|nr:phage/plasmid primase, P4 family [Pelagibius sp.]